MERSLSRVKVLQGEGRPPLISSLIAIRRIGTCRFKHSPYGEPPSERLQLGQRASCALPQRGDRNRCDTVCPRRPSRRDGRAPARPQAFPHCLAARLARCRRSGNRRADMRPETRDLAGGHETLRQVEIEAVPMARPQGRQSLDVSCLARFQCLAVSMSR